MYGGRNDEEGSFSDVDCYDTSETGGGGGGGRGGERGGRGGGRGGGGERGGAGGEGGREGEREGEGGREGGREGVLPVPIYTLCQYNPLVLSHVHKLIDLRTLIDQDEGVY